MRTFLNQLEKGLLLIATAALFLIMMSVSIDALGRYLFAAPFRGNFEVTSLYFMVILVFACLSVNYSQGLHVRLDVLSKPLRARFGKNYNRAIALVCLPVFILFSWHACIEVFNKFQRLETRMGAVPFPIYLSYIWVALGVATINLRFLLDVFSPLDEDSEQDNSAHIQQ